MKFFRRYGEDDDASVKSGRAYNAAVEKIREFLPKGASDLSRLTLHDGVIQSIGVQKWGWLDLDLTGGIDAKCRGYFRINVIEPRIFVPDQNLIGQWILADEIDLAQNGDAVLRLLTDHVELEFIAEDFQLVPVPFGQKVADRDSDIRDDRETGVLASIQALRASGTSDADIALALNDRGITARYGRKWNRQLVRIVMQGKNKAPSAEI